MKSSASFFLSVCAAIAFGRAPNIILMLVDDLGFNDIILNGSPQIPTPNINALAARGATLRNFYVQPVCSPTRASLLTGRHVIHTGVYDAFGDGLDKFVNARPCPYKRHRGNRTPLPLQTPPRKPHPNPTLFKQRAS